LGWAFGSIERRRRSNRSSDLAAEPTLDGDMSLRIGGEKAGKGLICTLEAVLPRFRNDPIMIKKYCNGTDKIVAQTTQESKTPRHAQTLCSQRRQDGPRIAALS
jgi:hypothetical protein